MKRILFRGKRFNGEWVYGFYTELKGVPKIINEYGVFDVLRNTVGQLAYRKFNLYEHDVIKINLGDSFFKMIRNYIIKFDEDKGMFYLKANGNYSNIYDGYHYLENCEYLGNIHDNPELLTSEVKK